MVEGVRKRRGNIRAARPCGWRRRGIVSILQGGWKALEWEILYHLTLQFISDCNSKRIIPIGLAKVILKYYLHLFMAHGIFYTSLQLSCGSFELTGSELLLVWSKGR